MKYSHKWRIYLGIGVIVGMTAGCGPAKNTEIVDYDSDGTIISCAEYDENGQMIKKTTYNWKGQIADIQEYDSDESESSSEEDEDYTYEYDTAGKKKSATKYGENGLVQELLEYGSEGNLIRKTTFEYDENNKLSETDEQDYITKEATVTWFYNDDDDDEFVSREEKIELKWDGEEWRESGDSEENSYLGADQQICSKFWSKQNETGSIFYDWSGSGEKTSEWLRKSESDQAGKMMQETEYEDGVLIRTGEFGIRSTYYNEDGSINYIEEYNSDEDIIKTENEMASPGF